MLKALHTAAAGMAGQQFKIDVTSNNLANVNTAGFKRSRAEFQDLLYQQIKAPGVAGRTGSAPSAGIDVGSGVKISGTERVMALGDLKQTDNPLDLAIEGDGFFQVRLPSGALGYTRAGLLRGDGDGRLVTPDGDPLDPPVVLPRDAVAVTVARDGVVSVLVDGRTDPVEVGHVELARFVNASALRPLGRNLFAPTTTSGEPVAVTPGQEGSGALLQGYLETSNVQVVEEMVELIASQRAYELNSKAIQAADAILQRLVNLR
ncbi:MAG: flagellar basal-body rod protein FlgG [Pseudomonadota bacterium]